MFGVLPQRRVAALERREIEPVDHVVDARFLRGRYGGMSGSYVPASTALR
jgi:hypothetical protein